MIIKNNTAIIDRKLKEDGYMAIKCLVNKLLESYEVWPFCGFIIYFEYKYEWEEEFYKEVDYIDIDPYDGTFYFVNDFDEGQTEYRLLGITPISELEKIEPYYKTKCD